MSAAGEPNSSVTKRVNHVVARWTGAESFEAGVPGHPTIRLDGARKAGPSPVDALLGALASCSAIDVVSILEKRRTPVASLEVEIRGERAAAVPARLTSVAMIFRITGDGIERHHAERAIDLSINKYCSVKDSLDPGLPIEWSLNLNGA